MKRSINVRVIPRAKKNDVIEFAGGFKVYLTVPPAEGKANRALLEVLARHLNLKKSQLSIIKGEKSRNKVIRVKNRGRSFLL